MWSNLHSNIVGLDTKELIQEAGVIDNLHSNIVGLDTKRCEFSRNEYDNLHSNIVGLDTKSEKCRTGGNTAFTF